MTKCLPSDPVCSRTTTDQVAVPPGSRNQSVPGDPVCRYAAGTQTIIPDPAN